MRVDDEFLKVAVHSGLLDQVIADEVQTLADGRGIPTSRAAVEAGKLNHDQVDVVEALRRPRDLVPGYELLSLLGQGGMGVVYRARQLAFDRVVALKMVRTGPTTPAVLARFEQEAKTIGRFAHPHVVTAFDFGKHDGRLFLAMEFLDGQDAEMLIQRSELLSENVVWGLIRQAAAGLMYAAERGVTHRDIKPANLLLVKAPSGYPLAEGVPFVKIADFGLALLQESCDQQTRLTQENSTVGSPHYMAPEQLTGSNVDCRADIYSLGATAYHLLCGQPPFHGFSLAQLYSQKLNGEPTSLTQLRPCLSAESTALVEAMMHRDPEQRPSNYAELLRRVDGLQQNPVSTAAELPTARGATAAPTVPTISTAAPIALSRRWPLVLVVILVMTAALGGAGLLWRSLTRATSGPRNWQPVDWVKQCFDGQSLAGWRTIRGSWTPGQNDGEGGLVLAGRGAIGHPLAKPVGARLQPLAGFRVLALGQLHEARVLELQFSDETPAHPSQNPLLVLQLTADAVRWGRRQAATGPLDKVFAEKKLTIATTTMHELRVENQAGEWLAYLNGELIGASPDVEPQPLEFRLAAEIDSGDDTATAWFSDVILEELGPTK